MSEQLVSTLTERLYKQSASRTPAPIADRTLDNVVFQDFVTYRYLLEPSETRVLEVGGLSDLGAAYIDQLEGQGASIETLDYIAEFLSALEAVVIKAFDQAIPTTSYGATGSSRINDPNPIVASNSVRAIANRFIAQLYGRERQQIWALVDYYGKVPNFLWDHVYVAFNRDAWEIARSIGGLVLRDPDGFQSSTPSFTWAAMDFGVADAGVTPYVLDYPFETFPANSANVGISLVYRQRWRPLGIQPGEIVRTVPLGPGQSEKITTKITRRKKWTQTVESSSESESITETSDTTKDSSEIINEASESQKWNAEAQASYTGLVYGASVSAGYESSHGEDSKETTSNLSEVMNKTASKIKKQSKINVFTETEAGFEEEAASTIRNENNEIAVTYYYHKLQQQYEVFTYIAEVRNVVFVAERVPAPIEINENWVRRHDWILARALKDVSFTEVLNELIQDIDDEELWSGDENPYESMAKNARSAFAKFTTDGTGIGQGGLTVPDIYSEPQKQLDAYLREKTQRARGNAMREIRRLRLYDHIRQNILHYCRAIWAAEDADQRFLRYRKEGRTVPVQWRGVLLSLDQSIDDLTDLSPNGVTVPLTDVLDVTGPIGFSGNYVVYPLRQMDPALVEAEIEVDDSTDSFTVTLPLQEVLNQVMRRPYAGDEGLRDPALALFIAEAVKLIRHREDKTEGDPEILMFENPGDSLIRDFLSFLPDYADSLTDENGILRNPDGSLVNPITARIWGQYLHRKNATRRFLVDSNNLYVGIHVGDGTALEPFKQAHRFIDVLQAEEKLKAIMLQNQRREKHLEAPGVYDPDTEKVVIVTNEGSAIAAAAAGSHTSEGDEAPSPQDPPGR